ncbi:hypothetical protein ACF8PU_20375 [Pseudomonas sp. GLN_6]|uniref:hypothetical protein n=1 Tax=Pseudomonas sp. GLN_6 TaxID=3367183 RepID=UPI00370C7009
MEWIPSANVISQALFQIDPMRTCCVENACYDEYDRVAASAEVYLEKGYTLAQALNKALRDSFGAELASGRDVSSVVAFIDPSAIHQSAQVKAEYHNEIDGQWYKEYLLTFSETGPITVRVKFEKSFDFITSRRMHAHEINQLIDPDTGDFLTAMTFDDHLLEMTRIDLSLAKKTLTIYARSPKAVDPI